MDWKRQGPAIACKLPRTGRKPLISCRASVLPVTATVPDLIFLDLNLPKRSGHELLVFIRADARLRSIPVVILSSSQAPSDILSAYSNGANSYFPKPKDLQATLDLMRTVEHYWLELAWLPTI